MKKDIARLKQLLIEKSYKEGEFTLTSGEKSNFYIDCKSVTLSPEGLYLCGKIIHPLADMHRVKGICGMTLGADPLVTAVSIASYLRRSFISALIVRKKPKGHGTVSQIEGTENVPPGSEIALIEDVVTTGSTLINVIDIVKQHSYKIATIITLVDRLEGGKENIKAAGYTLTSIFTKKDFIGNK